MTETLENFVKEPDFLAVSGSRLYGTNREGSDFDYRGFVLPPYNFIFGLEDFRVREVPGDDHKIYSLKYFLQLVISGDPLCTEMLFVPEDQVIKKTLNANMIINCKDLLLSNSIFPRITGFSYSEWRKARGVELEVTKRSISEDSVINDIRNMFHLEKDEMDQVVSILMSKHPRKEVSSIKNLGAKRKREFDMFGFGVSSASHSIRTLDQTRELMLTGKMTFPRPNAQLLKDIRQGKYTLNQVTEIYEDAVKNLEEAKKNSVLPDKPKTDEIWDIYTKIVASKVCQEIS